MTKAKELPPLNVLRDRLHYDPETGIFRWVNCGRKELNGEIAGTPKGEGYLYVDMRVDGKKHRCALHRVAWLMTFGELSTDLEIDHKNHIVTDNRITNLRLVTSSSNKRNRRPYSKTGEKYIYYNKVGKYAVIFDRKGWGTYCTLEEAILARDLYIGPPGSVVQVF